MKEHDPALRRLSKMRWRVALWLTAVMLIVYFGFIALTAYGKEAMGKQLASGLSVGVLLGAVVIVAAFALTGIYVHWANAHYDPELRQIQRSIADGGEKESA
jgi:uncharacterized membrane protein (DUF485 family)